MSISRTIFYVAKNSRLLLLRRSWCGNAPASHLSSLARPSLPLSTPPPPGSPARAVPTSSRSSIAYHFFPMNACQASLIARPNTALFLTFGNPWRARSPLIFLHILSRYAEENARTTTRKTGIKPFKRMRGILRLPGGGVGDIERDMVRGQAAMRS